MRRTYVAKGIYSALVCFSALAVSACHFRSGGGWAFGGSGSDQTGGAAASGSSSSDSNASDGTSSDSSNWPGTITLEITSPISKTVTFPVRFAQKGLSGTGFDLSCQVNVIGEPGSATQDDVLHPVCATASPSPTPQGCTEGDVSIVALNYFESASADGTTCPVAATTGSPQDYATDGANAPSSNVMVTLCKNNGWVSYMLPSAVYNPPTYTPDYSVRAGTIEFDSIAHSDGDSMRLTLTGVKLGAGAQTTDTITANITIDGVQLFPASDSCH